MKWPKLLLACIYLVFSPFFINAQQHSKADFFLSQKIQNQKQATKYKKSETVKVLVKGDVNTIRSIVNSNGGKFNYSAGNIASVEIPLDKIYLLSQTPLVERIEMGRGKMHPLNDTSLFKNNIVEIHSGQSPLPQAYDGTGVVIGFMDTGIDFTHPDFQDSLGKSRVKFLWDQNQPLAPNTPQPYNYGQEWDNTEIDAGMASAHNDLAYFGHGTHDIGIAAGNGRAVDNYKGMAPDADIIVVAMDFNFNNPQPNADAVDYIFSKAQAMGKPCVINASVGSWFGSHDGKDLEAQLIDALIKEQNGRAMVASAGNYGNIPFHLGYNVSVDSSFTWFKYNASFSAPPFVPGGGVYIRIWADTNEFKNVQFSIGADKVAPDYSFRGRTPYSTISQHLDTLISDTLKNNNNRLGIIYSYGDTIGSTYLLEFLINPDSTNYYWRFITKGSGKFDCWAWDLNDMVSGGLPTVGDFPDIARYKLPDTDQSIVSSFQCLESVITVGNYYNKKTYYDYTNTLYTDSNAVSNDIVPNSSHGPTRDGRIKPDITATGDNLISCGVLSMMPAWIANYPYKVGIGSKHISSGGTSASSPVVAGMVALYLQRNPHATYQQVKDVLLGCARQDDFTGSSLPNNVWGHGKLDGYSTLVNCGSVTTSSLSITQACAGDTVYVPYSATNAANAGNILTVELSNAVGNFSNPMIIGTVNGSNSDTIECILPPVIMTGSGYRIRVVSASPPITGTDNGNDITLNALPDAIINGNLSNCSGNSTILTAGVSDNYLWSTGATTQTIPVSVSGTYSLSVTGNNNCFNSTSVVVSIDATPTLSVSGNLTICQGEYTAITVSGAGAFRWNPTSDIMTANSDSSIVQLNPDTTGTYFITASSNGCDTTIAISLFVEPCLGMSEISDGLSVSVYPNPFSDQVFLEYDFLTVKDFKDARVEVVNMLGERIVIIPLLQQKNTVALLTDATNGIYFYRIIISNKTIAEGKISSINN